MYHPPAAAAAALLAASASTPLACWLCLLLIAANAAATRCFFSWSMCLSRKLPASSPVRKPIGCKTRHLFCQQAKDTEMNVYACAHIGLDSAAVPTTCRAAGYRMHATRPGEEVGEQCYSLYSL